jgi:hypothetical protein
MNITEILVSAINKPEAQVFVFMFLFAITVVGRYVRVLMIDNSDYYQKTQKLRSNLYFYSTLLLFLTEVAVYVLFANILTLENEKTIVSSVTVAMFFYFFIWTDFDYVEKYARKVTGKSKLNKSSKYYYQQLDEVAEYSKVYRFMASNRLISGHRPNLRP